MLAKITTLIEEAETELKDVRRRLQREACLPPKPTDPFDPVSCLGIWLAALHGRRAELLRSLH